MQTNSSAPVNMTALRFTGCASVAGISAPMTSAGVNPSA